MLSGVEGQLPSSTPTTPHTPNAQPPVLTWTPTIPTVSGTMAATSPSTATLVPAHAPGVTLRSFEETTPTSAVVTPTAVMA